MLIKPRVKKILLVTEEHTNNPFYWENVVTIKTLLQNANKEVMVGIPRELFLAVALETYKKFFQVPAVQEYVALNAIHLLIFNQETEEVVEWIRQKK